MERLFPKFIRVEEVKASDWGIPQTAIFTQTFRNATARDDGDQDQNILILIEIAAFVVHAPGTVLTSLSNGLNPSRSIPVYLVHVYFVYVSEKQ